MSETLFQKQLEKFGACPEARSWAGARSARRAWDECERPDWLFWLAGRVGVDHTLLVLAACACARTSLKFVPVGEDRPRCAIEVTEAWTRGEASIEDVRRAREEARRASACAYTYARAYVADAVHAAHAAAAAAHAAAYTYADAAAAAAAYAAAYAYTYADAAAAAAADAYGADAADAARTAAQRECSRLIRQHISFEVVREASRGK